MDSNYAFYLHFENLKNSLYRQLSGARQTSLFWPKFYYSWFYTDEKILYNILNLRQKLGLEITDNEISTYNKIRSQMEPSPSNILVPTKITKTVDGTSITYTDVKYKSNNTKFFLILAPILATTAHFLKMSRYWYVVSFAPFAIVSYMNCKYVPYGEIESFYNYLYEKRKADSQFKLSEKEIDSTLSSLDKVTYSKVKSELINSNKTLYEAAQELDETYLQAAIRGDSH